MNSPAKSGSPFEVCTGVRRVSLNFNFNRSNLEHVWLVSQVSRGECACARSRISRVQRKFVIEGAFRKESS